jgi:hypothetical protein
MKIKFWCDNNANNRSRKEETVDIEQAYGISDEEWHGMSEKDKSEFANEWAMANFEYGFDAI